ncbi:MAG: hypothetical protein ACRDJU_04885, partial [Actinomycetota bacterium]
ATPARSVSIQPVPAEPAFPGLPSGSQVFDLVGDPAGTGVWFLALDAAGADLMHWSGGSLESWPVGPGLGGLASALAIGPGGVAWVGLGTSLYRVNTATGAVTPLTVPVVAPVTNDPTMHLPGPPGIAAGLMWISGLAVGPGGELAIAHASGNAVQIYHPDTGSFASVALPAQTEVSGAVPNAGIAFGGNGVLAMSLADFASFPATSEAAANQLGLWQQGGSLDVLPIAAYGVQAVGSSFVAGPDAGVLVVTGPVGSPKTTSGLLPVGSSSDRAWAGGRTFEDGPAVVYNTVSGVAVADPSGDLTEYRLPGYTCQPGTGSGPFVGPGQTPPALPTGPQTCTAGALQLALDGAGNVWYASTAPGTTVGELPAATVTGQRQASG